MAGFSIETVAPENLDRLGFFCVRNKRHPGYVAKSSWLKRRFGEGLRIGLILTEDGAQAGFMEYAPAESSWRVVDAPGHLVIHCLWVSSGKFHFSGMASALVEWSLREAESHGRCGAAVVTSDGP
jgi:hypothetical protein